MTAQSPADLAATVRKFLAGRTRDRDLDAACAALDALVARCEQAERREELALNGARAQSERAEAAEARVAELERDLDGTERARKAERAGRKVAERERDEAKKAYHEQRGLRERADMDAVESLARVAQLEAALRGYMATHDVIAQGSRGAIARCECGQCRGTRAALAGEAGA